MSQQESSQLSTQRTPAHVGLATLLVACATGLTGCVNPGNLDVAKCMIPPHHPHEFEAPPNFGYFPTLWRSWPGAEAGPGYSPTRPKQRGTGTETTEAEPLPPPSGETTPPDTTDKGEMNDIFELPPDTPGETPAEPGIEMPGETPAAPAEAPANELIPPSNEPAGDVLPDNLMPEPGEDPAAAPPDRGAFNLETLPLDAPEGSLVAESPGAVDAKPSAPVLLRPGETIGRSPTRAPARVEKAERPSTTRGAATKNRKQSALAQVAFDEPKAKPAAKAIHATEDGPQLLGANQNRAETFAAAESVDTEVPETVAEEATQGWRGNPMRGGSQSSAAVKPATSTSASKWQRKTSRTEYPAMQATHTEPTAAVTAAAPKKPAQATPRGPINPLR